MKTFTGLLTIAVGFGAFLVVGASTADALPPSKGHPSSYHQKVKKQKQKCEARNKCCARPKTVGVSVTKKRLTKPYHLRKKGFSWNPHRH